ncbi:hypothetical protein SEA_EDEN_56 [Microbacterium phage Eden]|uniref:Uncharacterized protein n=1 Tax=Microbacterium phage Eden TaxID=2250289 RepID=A0A345KWE9_9CAUD|nr:hypothetical protein HOT71_gp56 [Microbacterium phage Eden]AXH47351.1 hypothetical protein SEA_EDEN_56 [Microbacterium phage Eden]
MAKPTFQDYKDSGVLDPKPVPPGWLVRTASGQQFCTPKTREDADRWAEKIGGTVEWYTPIQSTIYDQIGSTYDH